jgi:hypothetical protein
MSCINNPTDEMNEVLARIEKLKGLKADYSSRKNSNELTKHANQDLLNEYDTLFGLLGNDDSTKACVMENIRKSTGGRRKMRSTRRRKMRKSKTKKTRM